MAHPMDDVWFWQSIVSPHMMGLAVSLARMGCKVTYVAEQALSADRMALGWQLLTHDGVRLCFATELSGIQALVNEADSRSVHVCQGVRGNGHVAVAQQLLAQRRLRQWVVMETVDDAGAKGLLKRLEYTRLFRLLRTRIEGVLATGYRTASWVVARGMPAERVFPFAYFLAEPDLLPIDAALDRRSRPFRFIYVGQLIERKRFDLLVRTLSTLGDGAFELWVVGSGPLEKVLRAEAEAALAGRVRWFGRKPSSEISTLIADTDCLVLPSRYDGWGSVVSEALMVGTPAICSEACGAAGVVRASGVGGVFPTHDPQALRGRLEMALQRGVVESAERAAIARWASALGGAAGATYLLQILRGSRPLPPWNVGAACEWGDES